jgi:hypothetical protein
VAESLIGSFVAGVLADAIFDGFHGDDAYLVGAWVAVSSLWFIAAGLIWRSTFLEFVAAAVWLALFAAWEWFVNGEGDGYPLLMGQGGLIAACVTTISLSIWNQATPPRASIEDDHAGDETEIANRQIDSDAL